MSATMRFKARARHDDRFKVLGMCMGVPELYAREWGLIRMGSLWAYETEHFTPERPTYVVPPEIVEAIIGSGASKYIVLAKLAEEVDGGLRIKGTVGEIEWLYRKRQNGAKGGRPRTPTRRVKNLPVNRQVSSRLPDRPTDSEPVGGATANPQVSSLSSQDPDPIPTPEIKEKLCHGDPEELSSDQRSTPPSDHQAFVAEFTELYHERTGEKPTWDGKRGKLVKQLLGQHGLATCVLRARKLFREQPGYIVGTPDLGTLVAFFDRLAGQHLSTVGSQRAPPRGSGPTARELMTRAKRLEEMGQ